MDVVLRVKQEYDPLWEPLEIPLRFLCFEETRTTGERSGKRRVERQSMWVVTTQGREVRTEVVWEIMHKRWDLENCGFHQLKTYSPTRTTVTCMIWWEQRPGCC